MSWPTLGRLLQFNLGKGANPWRPALVAAEVEGVATLLVFVVPGDRPWPAGARAWADGDRTYVNITLADHGEGMGCWRWPPREE